MVSCRQRAVELSGFEKVPRAIVLRSQEIGQMPMEAEPGFLGNTVRVGVYCPKKFLDLFRGLLIAPLGALTWLDVVFHFRLHLHSPRKDLPKLPLKPRPLME
jgi:hypothetical protein